MFSSVRYDEDGKSMIACVLAPHSVLLEAGDTTNNDESDSSRDMNLGLVETTIRIFSDSQKKCLIDLSLQQGDVALFADVKKLKSRGGFYMRNGGMNGGVDKDEGCKAVEVCCRMSKNKRTINHSNLFLSKYRLEDHVLEIAHSYDKTVDVAATAGKNLLESRETGAEMYQSIKAIIHENSVRGNINRLDVNFRCHVLDLRVEGIKIKGKGCLPKSGSQEPYVFALLCDCGNPRTSRREKQGIVLFAFRKLQNEKLLEQLTTAKECGRAILAKRMIVMPLSSTTDAMGCHYHTSFVEAAGIDNEEGIYLGIGVGSELKLVAGKTEGSGEPWWSPEGESRESVLSQDSENIFFSQNCSRTMVGCITNFIHSDNTNENSIKVTDVDNIEELCCVSLVSLFVESAKFKPMKMTMSNAKTNKPLSLTSEMVGSLFLDISPELLNGNNSSYISLFGRVLKCLLDGINRNDMRWKVTYDKHHVVTHMEGLVRFPSPQLS